MNYNPKVMLSHISNELNDEMQSSWVKAVNFIDSAAVPVVKVSCKVDLGS
jgi:hypothetical protein